MRGSLKTCIFFVRVVPDHVYPYHMTSDPTPYGGDGVWRYVYFFILVTHIVLSVAVIPWSLFTLARALREFERHRH